MDSLTTLDILYIVLSIFTSIIGTLLIIVLYRIIKILGTVMEMLSYYNKFKAYLAWYSQIPMMVKDKVFDFLSNILNNDEKKK